MGVDEMFTLPNIYKKYGAIFNIKYIKFKNESDQID